MGWFWRFGRWFEGLWFAWGLNIGFNNGFVFRCYGMWGWKRRLNKIRVTLEDLRFDGDDMGLLFVCILEECKNGVGVVFGWEIDACVDELEMFLF